MQSVRPSLEKVTAGSSAASTVMFPLPIVHPLANWTPSTTHNIGGFGRHRTAAVSPL